MGTEKDFAERAREQASRFSQAAGKGLESGRQRVAGTLDDAASALRERAERLPGGPRVAGAARSTAERLGGAAGYLRDHDASGMARDLKTLIRDHPTQSLLAAVATGFLIGRAMRGRS